MPKTLQRCEPHLHSLPYAWIHFLPISSGTRSPVIEICGRYFIMPKASSATAFGVLSRSIHNTHCIAMHDSQIHYVTCSCVRFSSSFTLRQCFGINDITADNDCALTSFTASSSLAFSPYFFSNTQFATCASSSLDTVYCNFCSGLSVATNAFMVLLY